MGAQVADKDTDQLPLGGHHSAIIQSFRQSSLGPLPRLGSTAFPGLFEPPGVRAAPSGVGWNSPHPGFCRGGAGRGAVAGQAVGSQLAAPQTGRWDPRPRWRAEVDTESPADLPTSSLRGKQGSKCMAGTHQCQAPPLRRGLSPPTAPPWSQDHAPRGSPRRRVGALTEPWGPTLECCCTAITPRGGHRCLTNQTPAGAAGPPPHPPQSPTAPPPPRSVYVPLTSRSTFRRWM